MGVEVEVQRSLYNALTAAGLTVVDFAAQAADGGSLTGYPYVEVGEVIVSEFDTATELGFSFLARIHTRSRTAGALEAKTVQGTIYAALHRVEMAVTGQINIQLTREMSMCNRAPDNSFHGVCEYRGLITTP